MKKTVILLILFLPVCSLIAQNESTVDKDGDRNDVDVVQLNDVNWSDFDVIGDDNASSFVTQSGLGFNSSDVDELGDFNSVDVTQVNNNLQLGGDNYNVIYQDGNGNSGTVTQVNNDLHPGDVNNSDIYQQGGGNSAVVSQLTVASPGYPNTNGTNDANVDQWGTSGHAEQIQEGLRLNATVADWGMGNQSYQVQGASEYVEGAAYVSEAWVYQDVGSSGNIAHQHQVGLQNHAHIGQYFGADNNVAAQLQVSANETLSGPMSQNNNLADIWQDFGDGNMAIQLQYYQGDGVPNTAFTWQDGSDNSSVVVQIGENNDSQIHDVGDNNGTNVWQDNGAVRPKLEMPLPIPWPAGWPQ